MIYAAQIRSFDNAITVGALSDKPLVPIRAFATVTEMRAELDKIWDGGDGHNLIRVNRPQVVKWFGSDFQTYEGRCMSQPDAEQMWLRDNA